MLKPFFGLRDDGQSPPCVKEIRMLQWMDKSRKRIQFTDSSVSDFDAVAHTGLEYDDLMQEIYGRV